MDLRVLLLFVAVMVAMAHSAAIQGGSASSQDDEPLLVEEALAEIDNSGAELLRQTRNVCWLGSWACNKYCKIFGQQGAKQGECNNGSCQCMLTG